MRTILRLVLSMVIIWLSAAILEAVVVINELFYDPIFEDTNKEFIELYNNGAADVDLTDWQIQWGGTTYGYGTYYFPTGTLIRAGDYLLIGGDLIATMFGVTPDLIHAFNFQNASSSGGGPTDAVRVYDLLLYHDTCLYDSPNTNNLEGDAGNPALPSELNPDVASGHSLSRITVGVDNNLATDWEDLTAPTPTPSQAGFPSHSNIADIRVNDSNGVPLYLDSLVTIIGIITCANQLGTSGPAYMYDHTAAIAVFDNTITSSGIAIGDSVVVTGWVGFFNGLTEIVDEPVSGSPDVSFAIISGGHTVTPIIVTPNDLNEDNEAQLVRINGAYFVISGLFAGGGIYYAYVNYDSFAVYIDAQTNIPGSPIPLGQCDLIGQVGQYDTFQPYFSNYQLIPRFVNDISAGPILDVGIASIWHNDNFFVPLGNTFQVYAEVVNYGNQPANFSVACSLFAVEEGENNVTPLALLGLQLVGLDPLQGLIVAYLVQNTGVGKFLLKIITSLIGDMNPYNNSKIIETQVFVLPVELFHDDGVANGSVNLPEDDGFAMRFNPNLDTPYTVNEFRVMTSFTTGNTNALVQLLDDDGPDGIPGSVLYESSQLMANGWNIFHINVDLPDGAFYVAYIFEDANTSALRYDSNWPSGQNWKKTNGNWSADPFNVLDYMIRASITIGPNVWISLNPIGSVVIPPTGGNLTYLIGIGNSESNPVSADVWVMVTLPNGNPYGPVVGPLNDIWLVPNVSIWRERILTIPGGPPYGTYSLDGYIGDYRPQTWIIYDEDHFNFYKEPGGDLDNWENSWFTDNSEPFESQLDIVDYPENFDLNQNSPNPFNSTTTISFALPKTEKVTLSIYDLSGRMVAKLIDSWREAGWYETTFDGSSLASGIYLYRLQAGEFTACQKMVLLK